MEDGSMQWEDTGMAKEMREEKGCWNSTHDLMITNTSFEQKDTRKWTWMAQDGQHTNMIDLVLIEKRWKTAVRNCITYQGADLSSDHSLVMCKIQMRLKKLKQERKQTRAEKRYRSTATTRSQESIQGKNRTRNRT